MSPQTNGICERCHKTILNEFYQITFRKKLYATMAELQKDLDDWIEYYNTADQRSLKIDLLIIPPTPISGYQYCCLSNYYRYHRNAIPNSYKSQAHSLLSR